jgi:hypothetical protein
MSSPRAVIEIKGRVKMAVLLNIRADVNIITTKIADAANLPVFEITPIKVETFTGHNAQLVGICREINI